MALGGDIAAAFGLLTRLPLPRAVRVSSMAEGIWAWPIAGLAVGLIGGIVYWFAWDLHLATWLASTLAIVATVVATGALHEDGLADTADGIGGGRDAERRLAIMKDSRIGSYGALALIASVGLRVGALAQLAEPKLVLSALILAGMVARAVIPGVVLLSAPARPGGLGASLGVLARPRVYTAWGIAALGVLLLAPHHAIFGILAGAVIVTLGMAWIGRRTLGGYTGDTLGAAEQLAEIAVLLAMAAT